jgi:DHA1 family multidrug resistance protein-like MFS transporter
VIRDLKNTPRSITNHESRITNSPSHEPLFSRDLFAVVAASFIGFTGFTLVMPFLPLYIRQLGVTDVGEIAVWTGMTLAVTPALTALCAPFWGRVADRVGNKLMVERALVAFVVVMTGMALVTRVWQLFALRALLGFFAGYGALTLSMAARAAPRDRIAASIGMVQTAQRLGPALGPVIGGVLAPLVGLRNAFLVSAGLYAFALLLVLVLYHEVRVEPAPRENGAGRVTFRNILAFENFLLLMLVIFGLQFVDRIFGPVLPLYVGQLGYERSRIPVIAGVLFSVLAFAAAFGHHLAGWLLARMSASSVITAAAVVAAAGLALVAVGPPLTPLTMAMALFGLCIGVAMTASFTAANAVIPLEVHSTGFGFLTSASLAGMALSPVVSGLVGAQSIRLVFVVGVCLLVVLALLVRRVMVERAPTATAPALEES